MKLILVFLFAISVVFGQYRKITSKLNPGCQSCGDTNPLVYTRAEGSKDIVHQLWDFTNGMPTVIYAIAGLNSTLDVLWDNVTPRRYNFSELPRYSFAATIDKIYEYNDLKDNGYINVDDEKLCPRRIYSLGHVTWRRIDSTLTNKEAMIIVQSEGWNQGVMHMQLDLLPFNDYAAKLPHLIHTSNSTLIDISLINMTTRHSYNSSRFAVHFIMTSTDDLSSSMEYRMRKSLDDEHTPGIFEIIEIRTPKSARTGAGGFMQFRPVAYTQHERNVGSSVLVHVSAFHTARLPQHSTLQTFFQNIHHDSPLAQDMFVSFGEPGDGFYKGHNYTSWSFTYGYGSPPIESFSTFVISIICIGLGVPVVLALSGIFYVVLRRRGQHRPTRLRSEE